MAKLLSLVGTNAAPVNLELPPDASLEGITKLITGTPPGGWCYLTAIVEGQEIRVHVRPDSFGAFFIHERPDN